MTPLEKILDSFRKAAKTEREKGTYFEELTITYLRYEATYSDLYSDVWTYKDWADLQGLDKRDTGIDLVAKTNGTEEFHAIQCKFYAEDYTVQKKDIDSFFTASGKKPFTHRVIVTTTNNWSEHAEDALLGQQPPVTKIDLHDLENSQIDWSKYQPKEKPVLKTKHDLKPHQKNALSAVKKGLQNAERGKLIMACGSGKTFTSLKIAEELAGKGKRVLFLVPSLSLLSQILTEWTQQSTTPLHSFAVCSDSEVGKKRKKDDDTVQTFVHELRYPATTDAKHLAAEIDKRHDAGHMSVVFSTYHSIQVISDAQKKHKLADFDLVICDEAHRTTGAIFEDERESNFVKVHDAKFIKAAKRIYMTATPRIYGDTAKAMAEKDNVALCSMDDETKYGEELHVLTFSEAVTRGLLVDYKVIVLTIDEVYVSHRLQKLLSDENNQLKVDDAAKIIGCWKALSKQGVEEDLEDDKEFMQRAVAFCQVIEIQKNAKTHKVSSKNIANMFQAVIEAYQEESEEVVPLKCEASHVDGSMNASEKEEKLDWLKADIPDNTCRVLSNVRCLSEGVDVPALDAVLFLTPRNSQVDVVQSVGRVMRTTKDKKKKRGYVILPVVIPTGMEPHEALNDNKVYKVVWDVLQALRSHDDRFDAMVNKLDLVGKVPSKMEVIAITDNLQKRSKSTGKNKKKETGKNNFTIGKPEVKKYGKEDNLELQFEIGEIERAIYAKLVKKCGNRNHWEDWANDIAKIANTHITRIKTIINNPDNEKEAKAFKDFADELRDDLNDEITDEEVIEMLAQHLITKPVFDALFEEYSFASNNPVSQAMQHVLNVLQEHRLAKEVDTLEKFYASVQMRAEGIDNAQGKQKIVVELYDKFFRNAFPRMTERLGIVYTPVEVVDFIIHSVNDLLQKEFGQTLGSEGVHIIDPFVGTGTFITRLMQSGLITKDQLPHKYKNEMHANEIVLLAYYIAAVNIEAVYHSIVGGKYKAFGGICLTDTFQLYEKDDLISELLVDNSDRRKRQKNLDIKVILGNPPYSAGQESANDNNQNISYPILDDRIRDTYAKEALGGNVKNLYDPYIRAIRWASDRISDNGVIGYVTNAGYLESGYADGLRKTLEKEFDKIYVFHLRGDARTKGEQRRREKDNVFGQGTRTPVAIIILVKNPSKKHKAIFWRDIGDYLSYDEKIYSITNFKSIDGISKLDAWTVINPDMYGDWVNQRDDSFNNYPKVSDKNDSKTIFTDHSLGLTTNRDVWIYSRSKSKTEDKIKYFINNYNHLTKKYISDKNKDHNIDHEKYIDYDLTKYSWSRGLKKVFQNQKILSYDPSSIHIAMYRPFDKQWVYVSREINEYVYKIPKIFPNNTTTNKVICVTGKGAKGGFSTFITEVIPDLNLLAAGSQCFPNFIYDKDDQEESDNDLFSNNDNSATYQKEHAVSEYGLNIFQQNYINENICKDDIFYYIYGLFHSSDYCGRYADNLTKELPRIPCVKSAKDFWIFSNAGRELAELHINYEKVKCYPVKLDTGKRTVRELNSKDYYVKKMKFLKKDDKSVVVYNSHITIRDIPLEAYDYIVNGKPALEWVMERQAVTTDKKSGNVNDANDWAIETMGNAKYPLELFQRVITVSLETMKIVNSLPPLDLP